MAASGLFAHTQGFGSTANGDYSHAEGFIAATLGAYSHAEGQGTTTIGIASHAEGQSTTTYGDNSHAEGEGTVAVGIASHAEGQGTSASADYSHAEGVGTIALGLYQHAQGSYNLASSAQSAFIVGNGVDGSNRSNLVFASGSQFQITGSLIATSLTGSLLGTASWALNALTASYVNTLNQNVLITGSATIGTSSLGASENTLTLGARNATSEGGQLGLNAPGGTYTSASMFDNYQNRTRLLRGSNAGSDAEVASWNMHTKQMSLPAYNSVSAFTGTAAANLAVDSGGNIITVSTSGGTVFPYTGNAVITGSLTVTQPIYVPINGAMYFQGGDDAALYDVNIVNTMGIYGVQDVTVGAVKLGSNGPVLYGSSSRLGIGTTNPSSASLTVNGNVWATSFTGSLQGSASFAISASWAPGGSSTPTFPYTGSAIISGSLVITGSLRVGVPGVNNPRIDTVVGTLSRGDVVSVDWINKQLQDASTISSLDWESRVLYDTAGGTSIDWTNRTLSETTNTWVALEYSNDAYLNSQLYYRNVIPAQVQRVIANTPASYYGGQVIQASVDAGVTDFQLVFLDTDGTWKATKATVANGASKMLGICVDQAGGYVLIEGDVGVSDDNSQGAYVIGADHGLPVYVSATTGVMDVTAPSGVGELVRIVGHIYYRSTTDTNWWTMKFRPSNDWYVQ